MNLEEYNGTKGKTVREKLESIVRTRTRHTDPPVVETTAVMITLNHSHVMDPESDPVVELRRACGAGDLVRFEHPTRGREVLALPTPETFRYALGGDPGSEYIRDRIHREAETRGRKSYIGAMNRLLAEVSHGRD